MRSLTVTAFALLISFSAIGCGQDPATSDPIAAATRDGGDTDEDATVHPAALKKEAASPPAGDWPWWRGPNFNGVAAKGQSVPTQWSETQNVAWKSPVPGRGHSSPIVVGERVLLTTADESQQVQSVLCYDRSSGSQQWKKDVSQGGFPPRIHNKNTHATPTPASDGERVFVVFCNNNSVQVTALDLEGNQLWQKVVGEYNPGSYKYGYAPSPLIYAGLLILASESDSAAYLVALDRTTGEEAWRTGRPTKITYSSPVVAEVGSREQLLISGGEHVSSYDPQTGRPLWAVPATTSATCGTVIWQDDLVFASGGYPKPETVCIRSDGDSGKLLWRNNQKCYEQSMLVHDGFIYAMNDGGIVFCWDAKTGEEQWKQRLGGPVSASPILAGGNIYATNERGETFVFRSTPQGFQNLAKNRLGDESFATPTICGDQIFLRVATGAGGGRKEMLYCIANGKAE